MSKYNPIELPDWYTSSIIIDEQAKAMDAENAAAVAHTNFIEGVIILTAIVIAIVVWHNIKKRKSIIEGRERISTLFKRIILYANTNFEVFKRNLILTYCAVLILLLSFVPMTFVFRSKSSLNRYVL